MMTNNTTYISPNQVRFSNLAEITQGPLNPSSTPAFQLPSMVAIQPTSYPPEKFPPIFKPVIQTQQQATPNSAANTAPPQPDASDISHYITWSKINVVIGAIILGIPCILLSKLTKKYREQNKVRAAKIWSRITLAVNVFVTFVFMCGIVGLITYYNGVY